jgi:hypothetical protein
LETQKCLLGVLLATGQRITLSVFGSVSNTHEPWKYGTLKNGIRFGYSSTIDSGWFPLLWVRLQFRTKSVTWTEKIIQKLDCQIIKARELILAHTLYRTDEI